MEAPQRGCQYRPSELSYLIPDKAVGLVKSSLQVYCLSLIFYGLAVKLSVDYPILNDKALHTTN